MWTRETTTTQRPEEPKMIPSPQKEKMFKKAQASPRNNPLRGRYSRCRMDDLDEVKRGEQGQGLILTHSKQIVGPVH